MLLLVLAAAITIDVMKPATLAFVAPGAAVEYGLKGPLNPTANALPVALYPLSGITGTVIGSFIWGWLSDKIGRRSAILIACIIFIATSTCGAMPAYWLNLVCCFFMGIGAGGMLPIAFTLISETIPSRHRGWVMVLVGGAGGSAGFILTSWLASTIGAPDRFGWRILWLIGLPLGLVLALLNYWIPESPRYLIERGRYAQARFIMARYGAAAVPDTLPEKTEAAQGRGRYSGLLSPGFLTLTISVLLFGFSIGLAQFGFQQWIPSNLEKLGFSSVSASRVLLDAAIIGFPLSIPVAYLYGFWSSRKTIALLGIINVLVMIGFAVGANGLVNDRLLLEILLIVPTWSISFLASIIAAYAVEIYPTVVRSHGSGMSAGATKFGGVLILALVAGAAAAPSVRFTALVSAVPLAAAIAALLWFGPETRTLALEQIKSRPGASYERARQPAVPEDG